MDTLTCWLFIRVLTQGFLGIYVTTLLAVYNFGSKSCMRLMFFFKMFKMFRNGEQNLENWENTLGFRDNCTLVDYVKGSHLSRESTCHREFISYQTVSTFQILLRQNFSNWSYFKVMKQYPKTAVVYIWAVFRTL